jgi:low temperature requirement protein LtrA
MENLSIHEILIIGAIILLAVSTKKADSKDATINTTKNRNMLLIAIAAVLFFMFMHGNAQTPGTPISIGIGDSNITNLIVLTGLAIWIVQKNADGEPHYKSDSMKWILIGLAVYLTLSAFGSPSDF